MVPGLRLVLVDQRPKPIYSKWLRFTLRDAWLGKAGRLVGPS